jgi:flagellar hook-associated protein 1 FlgK
MEVAPESNGRFMGTLFSTFAVARSGMQAAQVEMEVAGHNVANVNRAGYSRQRVDLGAVSPILMSYGQLGRGVQVMSIERLRDTFLDTVYRQQAPSLSTAEVKAGYYTQLEDLFQEPGEEGFSTHLNSFFEALNDFANNVEEQPVRMSVLTEAQNLAASLNHVAQALHTMRTSANEEIRNLVPQINEITARVADLNRIICESEANGTSANDLRDERDNLLDELSTYVNIQSRERLDGKIDVMIGGEIIVNGTTNRELEAVRDPTLDPQRTDLVDVRFVDTGMSLAVTEGQLHGALVIRDDVAVDVAGRLDEITHTLIAEINHIHNTGNGRDSLTGTIKGTNPVTSTTAPLTSAGLPFPVSAGSFDITVNTAGVPTTTTINITAATTLQSLMADLNAVGDITASIDSDNCLQIEAAAGSSFSFANDTSNALTALGINGMFTGYSAATIKVNQDLVENPMLLTSSYSLDDLDSGDNKAALDLADIRNRYLLNGGTSTINEYYESTIVRLGVDSRANNQLLDMQKALVDDYQQRRDEVSGVSIDEEVTGMMQFQRAYEASARVMNVINEMLETLINSF